MLQGPIDLEYVDKIVGQPLPGVFVLSRNSSTVAFVGRGDKELGPRIKEAAAQKDYRYFGFEYAKSAQEAFQKECEYFHKYNPKDNTNHPLPPPGLDLKCPVAGCKK